MVKKVYITKSVGDEFCELWYYKPINSNETFVKNRKLKKLNSKLGIITDFCAIEFENITGFKLKEGECKRVEIHIKVVK